jgi:hypothetical protein
MILARGIPKSSSKVCCGLLQNLLAFMQGEGVHSSESSIQGVGNGMLFPNVCLNVLHLYP